MSENKDKIVGMTTIKMTNKVFLNEFNPSFKAIANLPANPKSGKLKYAIKRTLGSVNKVGEAHSNKAREIYEDCAALTDEGNPKIENDKYVWKDSDNKKKMEKEIEKLNNEVIDLTVYPVYLSTITDAHKISVGLEINLGEFIIENAEMNRKIEEDEKAEKSKKKTK